MGMFWGQFFKEWKQGNDAKRQRFIATSFIDRKPVFVGKHIIKKAAEYMDASYICGETYDECSHAAASADIFMIRKEDKMPHVLFQCNLHPWNVNKDILLSYIGNNTLINMLIKNHHSIEHYAGNYAGYSECLSFFDMVNFFVYRIEEATYCNNKEAMDAVFYALSVFYSAVDAAEKHKITGHNMEGVERYIQMMYDEGKQRTRSYAARRLRQATGWLSGMDNDTIRNLSDSTIIGIDILKNFDSHTNTCLLNYIGSILNNRHTGRDGCCPIHYINIKKLSEYSERPRELCKIIENTMNRIAIPHNDAGHLEYSIRDRVLNVEAINR